MSSSTPITRMRKIVDLDNGGGVTFMYATEAEQMDPCVKDAREFYPELKEKV